MKKKKKEKKKRKNKIKCYSCVTERVIEDMIIIGWARTIHMTRIVAKSVVYYDFLDVWVSKCVFFCRYFTYWI